MKTVILTGNQGGIGRAIEAKLHSLGFNVIGIDRHAEPAQKQHIAFDLSQLSDPAGFAELSKTIDAILAGNDCVGLINNAAVQILGSLDNLTLQDFETSLKVNLIAPLALSKMLSAKLRQAKGQIINIGTIHTELTKPEFISYATSKAGLKGLTKSMAVDIGQHVKVNMISPAAIKTDMLMAGFVDSPDQFSELEAYHPTRQIGSVNEVATLVGMLLNQSLNFMNGAIIELDGGISSRLHDPV